MTEEGERILRCVLGFDVGTSSSKAVLVALDGTVVDVETLVHEVSTPAPGFAEMDGAVWLQEFDTAARALLTRNPVELLAIGVSGMGPCLLLTDENDQPLAPAVLYGIDSRATREIVELDAMLGEERLLYRCGATLSTQAIGPKVRWFARHAPTSHDQARRWYMPSSWLVRQLTGEYVLDFQSASQCTPMFDLRTRDWAIDWCDLVAPRLELPRLLDAGAIAGTTRGTVGGIAPGVPVLVGTIDAWAEAASVGVGEPGDLMLMYGSTLFLVLYTAQSLRHPALWSTAGLSRDESCLAGGMATSGSLTSWIARTTGRPIDELEHEALELDPGADGLVLLPYFAGERTPILDPLARGVFAGLSLSHQPRHLFRAALESIAHGARHNVETMASAGAHPERVVAVGGGANSALWTQIVSDVTGLVQEIPTTTIGASYGMAHLAASAVADVAPIGEWNPVRERRVPDHDRSARYESMHRIYRALYPATADLVHELARMTPAPRSERLE